MRVLIKIEGRVCDDVPLDADDKAKIDDGVKEFLEYDIGIRDVEVDVRQGKEIGGCPGRRGWNLSAKP